MDIILLRQAFNHINGYSGYENFISYLGKENITYTEVFKVRSIKRYDFLNRVLITKTNKKKAAGIGTYYNIFSFIAEKKALLTAIKKNARVIHNTHLEDNHGFLGTDKTRHNYHLIATAHQPVSWWKYTNRNKVCLQQLDLLIALTRRDQNFFEKIIPGRVRLVHHGVDTNFFTITKEIRDRPYRILFIGNWLRDIVFFDRVISKILSSFKEILVDIVSPANKDLSSPVFRLCKYQQVSVHYNLSEEQLRNLYNNSRLLFLPLIDSTANNALLEAAACGVPIVTSDIESVREYTCSSYTYYSNKKEDCVNYILDTIGNDSTLSKMSKTAKNNMINNFSATTAAKLHADIYREFL